MDRSQEKWAADIEEIPTPWGLACGRAGEWVRSVDVRVIEAAEFDD